MQRSGMSIRYVLADCDLYLQMHIYDNDKYMHIWYMIFKKQSEPLFLFYFIFLCFFYNSSCTYPICPLAVIQCKYVYD